jgi:uncharacterized membrane protein YqjE
MARPLPHSAPPAAPGLFESLQAFLRSWVSLLQTRLELVSSDLEEQRARWSEIIVFAAASAFCLSFGLLLLTLFVVVLFWDTHRLLVLGGFTFLYLAAGLLAVFVIRKKLNEKPRILSATLAELSKDLQHLSS